MGCACTLETLRSLSPIFYPQPTRLVICVRCLRVYQLSRPHHHGILLLIFHDLDMKVIFALLEDSAISRLHGLPMVCLEDKVYGYL